MNKETCDNFWRGFVDISYVAVTGLVIVALTYSSLTLAEKATPIAILWLGLLYLVKNLKANKE